MYTVDVAIRDGDESREAKGLVILKSLDRGDRVRVLAETIAKLFEQMERETPQQ